MPGITAASILTKKLVPQIIFSDLTDNLDIAPNSGDLAKVTNADSVGQSIRNIVLTTLGERLYDNTIGSTMSARLFETSGPIQEALIETTIRDSLQVNEPRASILQVTVSFSANDALQISILYRIANLSQIHNVSVIVKKGHS